VAYFKLRSGSCLGEEGSLVPRQCAVDNSRRAHEQKKSEAFLLEAKFLSCYTNRTIENTMDSCKYVATENPQVGTA
jgi:hypothetical protein